MWCPTSHLCEVSFVSLCVLLKNENDVSEGRMFSSASVVFTERGVENGTEDLPYSTITDAYTQSKAKAEQLILAANGRRVTSPLQTLHSPTSRRRSRSSSPNTESDNLLSFFVNLMILFFIFLFCCVSV
jgi:ABC-type Na+ efflux pump permease subunit